MCIPSRARQVLNMHILNISPECTQNEYVGPAVRERTPKSQRQVVRHRIGAQEKADLHRSRGPDAICGLLKQSERTYPQA